MNFDILEFYQNLTPSNWTTVTETFLEAVTWVCTCENDWMGNPQVALFTMVIWRIPIYSRNDVGSAP